MPGFDGTGPMGKGSMTGRGLGNCVMPLKDQPEVDAADQAGQPEVSRRNAFFRCGRGFGAGRRGGRGRGFGRFAR